MALGKLKSKNFQVEFLSHAEAIFSGDFGLQLSEIEDVLAPVEIPIKEIIAGGGGESAVTQRIRRSFATKGWTKKKFEIEKVINSRRVASISHEVDHVRETPKGTVALEIEWNNKDPFFDRDLENFKRLHAEGAISIGVIVTRGTSLHESIESLILKFAQKNGIASFPDLAPFGVKPTERQRKAVAKKVRAGGDFVTAWASHFCADKFGEATTHWKKLEDRVKRGVGNPCPLLLIGIPESAVKS